MVGCSVCKLNLKSSKTNYFERNKRRKVVKLMNALAVKSVVVAGMLVCGGVAQAAETAMPVAQKKQVETVLDAFFESI